MDCLAEALCSPLMPMSQVDEAAPLWSARSVRGACESQSAEAEALCPHRQEVEQPPPDLQVGTRLPRVAFLPEHRPHHLV